jgi:hypothetical protein
MAADQKNFQNYLYVDDNGVSWTKRGEVGPAAAVDGHATGTNAPTWTNSARMKVRKIIYQDPTTFRTISPVFYTAAAFAAVALGDIVAVHVEGNTAAVNYSAVKKIAEKQPFRGTARQLADHA